MKRTGIFYGSTTGNTQAAAELIEKALGNETAELKPISDVAYQDLTGFDLLILGSPTWGYGDLQDEWETALPDFDKVDLTGKRVALFGLGDQEGYPDTFDSSRAVENGKFIGLPLDDDNQGEMNSERLVSWVDQLKKIIV